MPCTCGHWILALRASLGIAPTLTELGIDAARIDELADMAATDPTAVTNPVSVDRAALKSILINALDGRLG